MPPVLAILPVIAGVAATALGASALVSAIVVAVVTIASMVATKLLTKKPTANGGNRINQGAELATKINPSLPRTVCIGQTAIGPSCHFAFTYTDDSDKPNRYLVRVLQISDQPINSLLAVYDGKQTLTFSGDPTTGWVSCNQHKTADGAAAMWIRVYKGVFSGAVADATLISISGGAWTSAHKGTGLSYAIVKYDYDADAFPNGEPELVFAVQGAKLYDDRKDSTVLGGSGSQRLNNPATWTYTDNTAVAIAQYLRGFTIGGKRILGVGAESRDLLPAMLFSAYNTCDQNVSYSGGTEKRYVTGINLGTDDTAENHLTDLAYAMDGKIFDRGGSITLWPGAVRTPVMNVQMQDIDWTAEKSWQPKAGLSAMVNCVQGNFIDKDNFYQERDLPIRTSAQWEADDGGERFSTFVSLKGVNRWSQGQRITHRMFQSSRFNGVMAVVGGLWLMEMEAGDWYTASIPRWNFSNKYFEVSELTLTTDMRVAMVGTEVSTTLDDWDPASNEFVRGDTYWEGVPYDMTIPTFNVTPYSFYDSLSGVQDFGFNFQLMSPSGRTGSYIQRIEIQYALTSNLTDTYSAGSVQLDQPKKTQTGLLPSTSYSVRARSVQSTRTSAWSDWKPVVTTAPNTAFASALAGIADDNVLTMKDKRTLQKIYTDLEQRYSAALTRAGQLFLSTTSLTTAHTNWLDYLNSLSPAWNDTRQNTTIYTGVFPDEDFPTGWTLSNATLASADIWTNVTDASTTATGSIQRSVVCTESTEYSAGILIKKDAIANATRNPLIWITSSGGAGSLATLAVDTSTGGFTFSGGTVADVTDMGDSWYAWITVVTGVGDNLLTFQVFPAGSTGLGGGQLVATTGTTSFRSPALALGDVNNLGANALVALETELVNAIEDVGQAISTTDGATSVIIDPTNDIIIHADYTGTILTGELPRAVPLTASIGLNDVTTLGTWTRSATVGVTCTIGASTGVLSITAFGVSEALIPVSFSYEGVVRTALVHVVKQNSTTGGGGTGGGGSGGTTATTGTLGNTAGVSYNTSTAVSATITAAAGSGGKVALTADVSYKATDGESGPATWGKWQWRVVGGTFADVGAEIHDQFEPDYTVINESTGSFRYSPGQLTVNQTKTGLTNGTNYEFRFLWRDDGTIRCRAVSPALAATGS